MNSADISFLQESFKRYYFERRDMIEIPDEMTKREFGYARFGGGMVRHLEIKDANGLHAILMESVPSDVYCSNGYYMFPGLSMSDKDWQEADLIFDIDAKDLGLSCRPDHCCIICGSCGAVRNDGSCPCGSDRHAVSSLPCTKCMDGAKKEAAKLIHILGDDLGIPAGAVRVYFSGNEGLHLHLPRTAYNRLESRGRAALADYVRFSGAIPEAYGMRRAGADRRGLPKHGEAGWRGRLASHMFGAKSKYSQESKKAINAGYDQYAKRLSAASLEIGARIDPQVTGDVHRIFRLPGSLNSKSGLAKAECADLAKFSPYKDACLLDSDAVRVAAQCPVRFSLKNKSYGPYDGEEVKVERFAAAYMVCKGIAHAV